MSLGVPRKRFINNCNQLFLSRITSKLMRAKLFPKFRVVITISSVNSTRCILRYIDEQYPYICDAFFFLFICPNVLSNVYDAEWNAIRVKSGIRIARCTEDPNQNKMKCRNVVSNQIEGCLNLFGHNKRFSKL